MATLLGLTEDQVRTARQSAVMAPLAGEPCIACGQPALALMVKFQIIKHVNPTLNDCDAGPR